MTKKPETKTEQTEREYIIPLRVEWRKVPRYKRAAKAIKAIREFLVRHMKIYDKDLNKIKIDKYLNEFVWIRGIKKPPHKIKVKAIRNKENIKVELVDFPDKLKFKKLREEKKEKKAEESGKKKKTLTETKKKEEETKAKKDESQKKASIAEETQKIEKSQAKEMKHLTRGKEKKKTQPQRKALAK